MSITVFKDVVMIPVDRIVPNDYNPNEMDPKKFELLREEIRQFGWVGNPLIVRVLPPKPSVDDGMPKLGKADIPYEIIDGENRWRAGKLEGMTEAPCVILDVPDKAEASFKTYVLNNFRGEINEVKLAVLINNWHQMGQSTNAVFKRIGLRGHKQRALMESLKPKDMSKKAFGSTAKGQHRSFAVILTLEEDESVHRAIKLTRLHDQAECLLAIVDFYLDKHTLTKEQEAKIQELIDVVDKIGAAEGLTQLCRYYLEKVQKGDIRKDD